MNISIDQISKWIITLQGDNIISHGTISVCIDKGIMDIKYKSGNKSIKIIRDINNQSIKWVQEEIRGFIIDIYYEYEWDGHALTMDELCGLMGVSNRSTVLRYLSNVEKKIGQQEKFLTYK